MALVLIKLSANFVSVTHKRHQHKYYTKCFSRKGCTNKNKISNFRPVSVLNIFSKIYERARPNSLWHRKIFFTVFYLRIGKFIVRKTS